MTNYDVSSKEKAKNEGIELANKHLNMAKEALVKESVISFQHVIPKMVKDLTMDELFNLIINAVRECKRQDDEKAEKQYGELWLKRKKELNPLF